MCIHRNPSVWGPPVIHSSLNLNAGPTSASAAKRKAFRSRRGCENRRTKRGEPENQNLQFVFELEWWAFFADKRNAPTPGNSGVFGAVVKAPDRPIGAGCPLEGWEIVPGDRTSLQSELRHGLPAHQAIPEMGALKRSYAWIRETYVGRGYPCLSSRNNRRFATPGTRRS